MSIGNHVVAFLGVLCVIVFLVMAKFSFARLRRSTLEDVNLPEKDRIILSQLFNKPAVYFHGLQCIIVALLLELGYLLQPLSVSFSQAFSDWMNDWGMYGEIAGHILFLVMAAILVYVLEELIPKSIALMYPESIFVKTNALATKMVYIVQPLVRLVNGVVSYFLSLFDMKIMTEMDLVHSEEEILTLVDHSHKSGAIDSVESELIENVFDFAERLAKEVMVPRQKVVCLYADDSFEDNWDTILASKHTRYPLCEEDKDHVIGLIHVKDVIENETLAKRDLRSIKRDILVIPEVMKVSTLLQYMRTERTYQSIVVDEYGGMVGLVSLEDIIEELVGDIKDENEESKEQIVSLGEGAYDFDGTVLIGVVEETLGIELSESDEDTLGGYIFAVLGQTPKLGDRVEYGGYAFVVTNLEGYRIDRVEAFPVAETVLDEEARDEVSAEGE